MNILKLTFRSLSFYRRIHLWVVLGTMVSTTIIVGALIVGDSIRHSLRQIIFDRLGKTEFALSSQDRFFRKHIADKLSEIAHQTLEDAGCQTRSVVLTVGVLWQAATIEAHESTT